MKHGILTLVTGIAAGLLATNPGAAHSGSLAGNGRHPETSPASRTLEYCVAGETMDDGLRSGGKRYGS